jgi:hypothetical protein
MSKWNASLYANGLFTLLSEQKYGLTAVFVCLPNRFLYQVFCESLSSAAERMKVCVVLLYNVPVTDWAAHLAKRAFTTGMAIRGDPRFVRQGKSGWLWRSGSPPEVLIQTTLLLHHSDVNHNFNLADDLEVIADIPANIQIPNGASFPLCGTHSLPFACGKGGDGQPCSDFCVVWRQNAATIHQEDRFPQILLQRASNMDLILQYREHVQNMKSIMGKLFVIPNEYSLTQSSFKLRTAVRRETYSVAERTYVDDRQQPGLRELMQDPTIISNQPSDWDAVQHEVSSLCALSG